MAKILVTSEMIIQRLLREAGVGGIGDALASVDARGVEAAAVLRQPEVSGELCWYRRTDNFASPGGVSALRRYHALTSFDKLHIYAVPSRLRLNDWARRAIEP
jgi:hypothetical protein